MSASTIAVAVSVLLVLAAAAVGWLVVRLERRVAEQDADLARVAEMLGRPEKRGRGL